MSPRTSRRSPASNGTAACHPGLTSSSSQCRLTAMHPDATRLADDTASGDPAVGLAAVAALRALLESLEQLQVSRAREQGWSWQQIAEALGVSKQAVHKKYGGRGRLSRRQA